METAYYKVCPAQPDIAVLHKAADILRQGGLVAFPTETVYGLGANGLDGQAVAGIYRAKGRPSDNPLILHIADSHDLHRLAAHVPVNAQALMDAFWPGPLTIVLERTVIIPNITTGGLETVAIRMPDSTVARQLIRLVGMPLAAPSANTSGRPSPTTAQAVLDDLAGKIDAVIDAGAAGIGLESTVVDCTLPVPMLLRPGGITAEMLEQVLGAIEFADGLAEHQAERPKSPGMKYTHYAPAAPLILLEGSYERLPIVLQAKLAAALAEGKRVGALVSSQTAARLPAAVVTAVYGSRACTSEIAAQLYTALRSFDHTGVDVIFAEGIDDTGLGLAVMNRLRKAAGYHIISV